MEEFHLSEAEFTKQSLANFFNQFPDESSCFRLFPADCKACGHDNEDGNETARSFNCLNCKTLNFRTAGTYFHGLETLRPTLCWIWLHEDRALMSKMKLSKLFNIVYSTAWEIDARLKAVIEDQMMKHDAFEVLSRAFDPVIFKRSDQSIPNKHPSYVDDDDDPDYAAGSEELEDLDPDQQAVYTHLTAQPIAYDVLHEASGLEVDKFASAIAVLYMDGVAAEHSGNKFSLKKTNPVAHIGDQELDIVGDFLLHARNFHGVSRKYLQRHLASFWSRWGRNRWSKQTLMKSCMKYRRPSRSELIAYVSPKMLRIPWPV